MRTPVCSECEDAARKAICIEIGEALKKRGYWVPGDYTSSDLILAVARALDAPRGVMTLGPTGPTPV